MNLRLINIIISALLSANALYICSPLQDSINVIPIVTKTDD